MGDMRGVWRRWRTSLWSKLDRNTGRASDASSYVSGDPEPGSEYLSQTAPLARASPGGSDIWCSPLNSPRTTAGSRLLFLGHEGLRLFQHFAGLCSVRAIRFFLQISLQRCRGFRIFLH